MSIFIGGAWPYANGSLHIGHIAALLPGDIIARYYRQKGEDVLYVSGTDCNGTPISIKAKNENTTVKDIANKYHEEFKYCFEQLGFSYDFYARTDSDFHHRNVQDMFLELLKKDLLYIKKIKQAYCENDKQFLPDRFVEGTCPHCGSIARGDQCDNCSAILDPLDLIDKKCKICGEKPIIKDTEHFYYRFSSFQKNLEGILNEAKVLNSWRRNAINLTERYLQEGIHDRAVTRDLPNGVPVPIQEYKDKKIYVWLEAVAGYYTASKQWAEKENKDYLKWWNNTESRSYYVHGKDNIPFHTLIWPSITMGLDNIKLEPNHIVSSEYMTLEKKKISTSKNWAVWITDLLESYHPDSIRYFFSINAPEQHDSDFSWREFIYSHNSELLGAYGNFINRTFKFVQKNLGNNIPESTTDEELKNRVRDLYQVVSNHIENGEIKIGLEKIFEFIRFSNKYFDIKEPWNTIKSDFKDCEKTIATCIYIIQNLSQILRPYLPSSSNAIGEMLGENYNSWTEIKDLPKSIKFVKPLYERIDIEKIEQEREKLTEQ